MFCKSFHLSSLCIHCHSFPGSGSLKPQREAPGAAWRTEAGSGTADLNLMRMNLMSRTHQIQVDDGTERNQMSCETTNSLSESSFVLVWKSPVFSVLCLGPGWTANFRDSRGTAASQTPAGWDSSAGGGAETQGTGWANFTEFQPFSGWGENRLTPIRKDDWNKNVILDFLGAIV